MVLAQTEVQERSFSTIGLLIGEFMAKNVVFSQELERESYY